tara:strand:- start:2098 stop:2628 length:531 start_codon:yes stop_codon:yes gene_type:complete
VSTLLVAELQAQVETDYADATLQQIIDAVERDIVEHVGAITAQVAEYDSVNRLAVIRLPVQAASITTVVEYTDGASEPTKTTLSADDYELSDDSWFLRRLSDGTNTRSVWGWHVVVTFEPADDEDRRKQAAIQLARLEITHTGYSSERAGDWNASSRDLAKERSKILRRLDSSMID